jgi:hypothetical protein
MNRVIFCFSVGPVRVFIVRVSGLSSFAIKKKSASLRRCRNVSGVVDDLALLARKAGEKEE